MFDQHTIQSYRVRYAVMGIMILVLLAAAPFAGAMGGDAGATFSGDDDYDPAAGGLAHIGGYIAASEQFALTSGVDPSGPVHGGGYIAASEQSASTADSSLSGDDDYDPAAGGDPEGSLVAASDGSAVAASSLGGDDYDPTAGGDPDGPVAAASDWSAVAASSLSGDDAYDPAAGGLTALSTFTITEGSAQIAACESTDGAIIGVFSGDDAYDPAARGNPEGAPIGFACAPPAADSN